MCSTCSTSGTIRLQPALHPAQRHELDAVDRAARRLGKPAAVPSARASAVACSAASRSPSSIRCNAQWYAICHRLSGCPIRSASDSKIAHASPHRCDVAGLQRCEVPVVVGVQACGRVAEIVGEVARLGVPLAAELEGLGHRDRLVARVESRRPTRRRRPCAARCRRPRCAIERRSSKSVSHVRSTHSSAEQARAVGAVRVAESGERAREHLDAFVVDRADDAVPASVVSQRGADEDVDRVDVVGEAAGREQGLAVRRITRLSLRVAESEEQRGATSRIVVGRSVEQIERIPVPAQRLVGRELRRGRDRPPVARTRSPCPTSGGCVACAQW